jgi:hypothetical protein
VYRYLAKAECVVQQYGNYTITELDNLPLNGINTQVSVSMSYTCDFYLDFYFTRVRTLRIMEVSRRHIRLTVSWGKAVFTRFTFHFISDSWTAHHGPEPLLPGLPYSQSQLFWISAANVWCAKYRPKALKLRVLTGVHSPDMFRVQV